MSSILTSTSGARSLQDFLRAGDLLTAVAMHAQQYTAAFDPPFVALRLVLRQTPSDQCTDQAADRASGRNACGRTFRRLRVLLMREVLRPLVVRQEDRNCFVAMTVVDQCVDGGFSLSDACRDTEYSSLCVFHVLLHWNVHAWTTWG